MRLAVKRIYCRRSLNNRLEVILAGSSVARKPGAQVPTFVWGPSIGEYILGPMFGGDKRSSIWGVAYWYKNVRLNLCILD